jgi:hypothetical protein
VPTFINPASLADQSNPETYDVLYNIESAEARKAGRSEAKANHPQISQITADYRKSNASYQQPIMQLSQQGPNSCTHFRLNYPFGTL